MKGLLANTPTVNHSENLRWPTRNAISTSPWAMKVEGGGSGRLRRVSNWGALFGGSATQDPARPGEARKARVFSHAPWSNKS